MGKHICNIGKHVGKHIGKRRTFHPTRCALRAATLDRSERRAHAATLVGTPIACREPLCPRQAATMILHRDARDRLSARRAGNYGDCPLSISPIVLIGSGLTKIVPTARAGIPSPRLPTPVAGPCHGSFRAAPGGDGRRENSDPKRASECSSTLGLGLHIGEQDVQRDGSRTSARLRQGRAVVPPKYSGGVA
jgi:hypothetical protein